MAAWLGCEKCHQPHPNGCHGHITGGAHPERKGEPCRQWPVRGATVCSKHGANARTKAKGRRLIAEDKVRRKFLGRTVEPVVMDNPLEFLRRLTAQCAEDLAVWETMVSDLADHVAQRDSGPEAVATLKLYNESMDRAKSFIGEMVRLGIEDKLAAIDEAIATKVLDALDAAIAEAEIPGPQAQRLRLVTAEGLRRAT